jgi:hypothetical protein
VVAVMVMLQAGVTSDTQHTRNPTLTMSAPTLLLRSRAAPAAPPGRSSTPHRSSSTPLPLSLPPSGLLPLELLLQLLSPPPL